MATCYLHILFPSMNRNSRFSCRARGPQAEEDGHHGSLGPLRQAQAVRRQAEEDREEEEDEREELQPESLLERVLRLHHRGDGDEESHPGHHGR